MPGVRIWLRLLWATILSAQEMRKRGNHENAYSASRGPSGCGAQCCMKNLHKTPPYRQRSSFPDNIPLDAESRADRISTPPIPVTEPENRTSTGEALKSEDGREGKLGRMGRGGLVRNLPLLRLEKYKPGALLREYYGEMHLREFRRNQRWRSMLNQKRRMQATVRGFARFRFAMLVAGR